MIKAKRASAVAQVVEQGPEFKPKCTEKEKKQKKDLVHI
jgi:hypothetical protein